MEPTLFFNLPNCLYWVILAMVIAGQGVMIGDVWPEEWRWELGFDTLFVSSMVMVIWFGWDAETWAGLGLLAWGAHLIEIDRLLVGNLWSRRESHRWTLQYFASFLTAIPLIVVGWGDIVTWGLIFTSLGICGAVKVGREAYQDSRRAQHLRRQQQVRPPEDAQDGLYE